MKWMKKILLALLGLLALILIGFKIYSMGSYEELHEMVDTIEDIGYDDITYHSDFDEIRYYPENPFKKIVFVPGGLVEPESYKYLAFRLAHEGYDVTISKAVFNLAIFTPNYAERFLSEELDNVVIGHSLGGVVGSMVASGNDFVDEVILMGSYPIKDLTDKDVLFITAEHDEGMNPESFEESLELVDSFSIFNIEGGNHAQFGWYGPQKGDGTATIDTLTQQEIVIEQILLFLK